MFRFLVISNTLSTDKFIFLSFYQLCKPPLHAFHNSLKMKFRLEKWTRFLRTFARLCVCVSHSNLTLFFWFFFAIQPLVISLHCSYLISCVSLRAFGSKAFHSALFSPVMEFICHLVCAVSFFHCTLSHSAQRHYTRTLFSELSLLPLLSLSPFS